VSALAKLIRVMDENDVPALAERLVPYLGGASHGDQDAIAGDCRATLVGLTA
jgi:hypothetical protein